MFSNRLYPAKLFIPVAIVWGVSYWHYAVHRGYNPSFWEYQAAPERFDGCRLRAIQCVVTGVLPDGVEVSTPTGNHRIRCVGPAVRARVGDSVSFLATFHKGNYLEIHDFRIMHHWRLKRRIIMAASVVTFAVCVFALLRCFRTKFAGGIFYPE